MKKISVDEATKVSYDFQKALDKAFKKFTKKIKVVPSEYGQIYKSLQTAKLTSLGAIRRSTDARS